MLKRDVPFFEKYMDTEDPTRCLRAIIKTWPTWPSEDLRTFEMHTTPALCYGLADGGRGGKLTDNYLRHGFVNPTDAALRFWRDYTFMILHAEEFLHSCLPTDPRAYALYFHIQTWALFVGWRLRMTKTNGDALSAAADAFLSCSYLEPIDSSNYEEFFYFVESALQHHH